MAKMKPFSMTRDINGYNGFGLEFTDSKIGCIITSGSEKNFIVPNPQNCTYKYVLAVFSFTDKGVWVSQNSTATLPSTSFATTNSELDPGGRRVMPGDVLSFITNKSSVEIGVIFYACY